MILKCILAVAFAAALVGLGIVPLLKNRQSNSPAQSVQAKSLKEVAQRTKAEGRQAVELPGPIGDFPGEDMDIDEALRDYTVVVAEPLTSKSYLIGDYRINTWYRFRIIDTISRRDAIFCYTCPQVPDAPADLPSLSADEFFLPRGGGTVTLDGVAVTMGNPNLPSFESGKRYLLILKLTSSGVAILGAGPTGVFQTSDNEHLEPFVKNDRRMHSEMSERFNLKLSRLKAHMK
ncbi:MAG: hypothetical protein QOF62_1558 [Pyrinomonadaceae bacterium]|jgi:hypothetical protein|nr:hypothetical protein [Pyrinomonadaceae bacterium]